MIQPNSILIEYCDNHNNCRTVTRVKKCDYKTDLRANVILLVTAAMLDPSFVKPGLLAFWDQMNQFNSYPLGVYQIWNPADLDEALKRALEVVDRLGENDDVSMPSELIPVKINPKNNDGRQTCFKCGGKTDHIDGTFKYYDICPKCKI